MSKLNAYLLQTNEFRKYLNKPVLSLNNCADRAVLAGNIDRALSPENLSCDGELPRDEVQKRYEFLLAVVQELREIDPHIQFSEV